LSDARSTFGHGDRRPGTGNLRAPGTALTGPILVVDDDAAIRAAISEILESEGYPVIMAADGATALQQIEETRPALVLLDMRMPGMNGWDVAATLHQRGSTVPILVMTAAQDARRWAEQIGAHGYLAKPFDLDDLLDAVERLLAR
jgi:CheY-like chemotaxis protein